MVRLLSAKADEDFIYFLNNFLVQFIFRSTKGRNNIPKYNFLKNIDSKNR